MTKRLLCIGLVIVAFIGAMVFVYALDDGVAEEELTAMAREIEWTDLLPKGVPYSEMISVGQINQADDIWKPEYDQNGLKLNRELLGSVIKLPGFIVPLDILKKGTREFLFVPYAGACIHIPPPPPNQIIHVKSKKLISAKDPYRPLWLFGQLTEGLEETELAVSGYRVDALGVLPYE